MKLIQHIKSAVENCPALLALANSTIPVNRSLAAALSFHPFHDDPDIVEIFVSTGNQSDSVCLVKKSMLKRAIAIIRMEIRRRQIPFLEKLQAAEAKLNQKAIKKELSKEEKERKLVKKIRRKQKYRLREIKKRFFRRETKFNDIDNECKQLHKKYDGIRERLYSDVYTYSIRTQEIREEAERKMMRIGYCDGGDNREFLYWQQKYDSILEVASKMNSERRDAEKKLKETDRRLAHIQKRASIRRKNHKIFLHKILE